MALFTKAAAGSGILSPIWPNLTMRFSTDGLGLVFEDPSSGFLLVWNADYVARAIEYSPGLFTPTLVAHTAFHVDGQLNGWLGEGPTTWNFKSYPQALAYDVEVPRYATAASPWAFPSKYTGSSSPSWDRESDWNTHNTGAGRRWITWPPMRGILYNPSTAKQAEAFTATRGWCLDQLRRPWAHISAPFVPFKGVVDYNNFKINDADANRAWDMNKQVTVKDRTGTNRNLNNFDPAHSVSIPPFSFALCDHPLGVVLLFLHGSMYIQGVPPNSVNSFGSYSFPFDQERSVAWQLELYKHCVLVGLDYMDPDLQRDWWGGLRSNKNNGGLGWTPRDGLRTVLDVFSGPEYGGRSSANPRYIQRTEDTSDDGFDADGHHQPYMNAGTRFSDSGNDYRRCFASEKGFHRYLAGHAVVEALRVHDLLAAIDATDTLLDSARVTELRRFRNDFVAYLADTGFIGDVDGTSRGHWRQRTHVFQHAVTEYGFDSFSAIDAAVQLAISHDPNCPYPSSSTPAWVYPGTDASLMHHIFVRQHERWANGAGLWHIVGGRPIGSNGGSDTEAHVTGIPFYAGAYGYDSDLAAMYSQFTAEMNDANDATAVSHYEPYWRAKEIYDSSGSRNVLPIACVAVAVAPSYTLSDVEIEIQVAPSSVTTAAVLGSWSLGSTSKSPAESTAVAVSVDPNHASAISLVETYRPNPAFSTCGVAVASVRLSSTMPPSIAAATSVATGSASYLIDDVELDVRRTPLAAFVSTGTTLARSLGSISIEPPEATSLAEVVAPGVRIEGTVYYSPVESSAVASASLGAYIVRLEQTVITPPAVRAGARSVFGSATLGSLSSEADESSAVAHAELGSYEIEILDILFLRPAAASVTCGIAVPDVALGSLSIDPDESTSVASSADPSHRLSHLSRVAEPCFSVAASMDPDYDSVQARIPENVARLGVVIAREIETSEVRL